MAQTGYTPILIYSSSTAAAAPAAGSLTNSTLGSELAINITDGKLFYKDNANAIQVIGWKVVPATAGGTGQTSYAVGDILYADTTTSLAKLADVATGNALISGGVGVAPSWGKIGLTTHVSGTLPVANGGTGLASYTANRILYASGTTTIATSAGLTFDGTNFATTGSATATAFIPSSSTVPSNGLYLPAANTIGFSTNTIERLRIDSSGDLRSPGKIFIEQVQGYGTNDLVVMSNNASKGIVFYTGVGGVSAVDRGRFTSGGDFCIGDTAVSAGAERVVIKSAGTSSATAGIKIINSAGTELFFIRSDGAFRTGSAAVSPYNNTTATAANVWINTDGTLLRSTSSLKYKTDIKDATYGLADVLKLRAVTYKSKSEIDGQTVYGGLIAEEVHDAGLTQFVEYAPDGAPDALRYANMASLFVNAIKELTARIEELEKK